MKTVKGDLLQLALDGEFDVVVHGCNCYCTMARGIALSIKNSFPEAFRADCATDIGSRSKLGTFSFAEIVRGDRRFIVLNAYTQFDWKAGKGSGVIADYEAIRRVMNEIKLRFSGRRIAYPKIGAGLAGGDWETISSIIREALADEDHTYVEYVS